MDWTCNIGETAVDIVIFSSSNTPLSIFVLGEAYEVCIAINSKAQEVGILLTVLTHRYFEQPQFAVCRL